MRRGIIRLSGAAISIGILFALLGAAASAWAACPECDEYKLVIPPVQSAGDGNSGPQSGQGEDTEVAQPIVPTAAPPATAPPVEEAAAEPAVEPATAQKTERKRRKPMPKPATLAAASSPGIPASRPLDFDTASTLGTGGALLIIAAIGAPLAAAALRRRRTELTPSK
jgi:hypothetical protein